MKTVLSIAALAFIAVSSATVAQDRQTAIADFVGGTGKASGRATLTAAASGGVLIEVEVAGLPATDGLHSMFTRPAAAMLPGITSRPESISNPTNAEHGLLAAKGSHAGDIPNQYVGQDGILRAQIFDGMVTLDGKTDGIRGRALIVHANSDDYRSQPAGDAGERLACGVIK